MESKVAKSLLISGIGAALVVRLLLYLHKTYIQSPLKAIGGPWWGPLLCSRSLLAIGATLCGWTMYPLKTLRAHRRYGSIMRVGPSWVSIARGDVAKYLLQSDAIDKPGFVYQTFRYNEYGDNLFTTLSHDEHKRIRKAIAPAFGIQHLRNVEMYFLQNFNVLSGQLDELIEASPNGEIVEDIWQKLKLFMADCLGDSSFGGSFGSLKSKDGSAKVPDLVYQIFSRKVLMAILTFLKYFPNPILNDAHSKTFELASYIEPLIDDRIAGKTKRDDLLQVLVEGSSQMEIEEGGSCRLVRNEIIANSLLMLSGGINTSSRSMAFALINLIRHPQVYRRLQTELDDCPVDPQTGLIPPDVCKQLPYLSACVNETLRLYGVTWIVRVLNRDVHVAELFLPEGTTIMVPLFVLMRDESTWANPDDFTPERFLDGSKKDHSGFLPFSTGEYTCIGRNFALNVMKICLANLLKRYEFDDVNPNHDLDLVVDGFTSLRYLPYMMKVRKRRNIEP